MKRKSTLIISAIILISANSALRAQSTWLQVYNIFQAKCASCHNPAGSGSFMDLSANDSAVYANVVGKTPTNAKAQQYGFKRIDPGYPHRSFIIRKINNGLDADNSIGTGEGGAMPLSPNPALSNYQIELVRQWVLHGAPKTGMVVDTAIINTFYTVGGINSVPTPLAPPSANGFQVHLGKIFVPPATETEIFIKYNPKLSSAIEINRIELAQSPQSHHFVIYKYYTGQDVSFPEGFRDTSMTSHGAADILTAFSPQTTDHVLPTGTAYFCAQNAVLDLNYHLPNFDTSLVLAAEVYFNVYTQPVGTAQKYMWSKFFPQLDIVIPPNAAGDTTIYTEIATDSAATNNWDIWIMYTHTHRYGTDYDVWKRNTDGSQGNQVYEGFYNFDYTFNQGYYGWGVHAPEEHFDPFLVINPLEGLIHRAKWHNYGTDTVYFGLTSQDEMMVMGFQYTNGDTIAAASIKDVENDFSVKVYPNPGSGKFILSMNGEKDKMKKTNVAVLNVLGEEILKFQVTNLPTGQAGPKSEIDISAQPAGIYFLQIISGDKIYSQKLMKVK